jgi:hypothetical protein
MGHVLSYDRYWTPRGINPPLTDHFLTNPDGPYGSYSKEILVTLNNMRQGSLHILLGEPGMGKTKTLHNYYEQLANNVQLDGDDSLFVDLGQCSDLYSLQHSWIQQDAWSRWLNGDHRLYLIMDALDEAIVSFPNIIRQLTSEFGKLKPNEIIHPDDPGKRMVGVSPLQRLNVIITCRHVDWPNSLELSLSDLWKPWVPSGTIIQVYSLAPLREEDVRYTAEQYELDPQHFLEEVRRKQAQSFASSPHTLQFLIHTYKEGNKTLPDTLFDLFQQGCTYLCQKNPDRCIDESLNQYQKLGLAAKIAALLLLSGRSTISTESSPFNQKNEDKLYFKDIYGEVAWEHGVFEAGDKQIAEVINTGLFTGRGPNRISWAQKTYVEFLAAKYLLDAKLPIRQLLQLLTVEVLGERRVVQQHRQIANWICIRNKDFLRYILDNDPLVLLGSDIGEYDDPDVKAGLVEQLIDRMKYGNIHDFQADIYSYYAKLYYTGLAEQLRPVIEDRESDLIPRRAAIDIAVACGLTELADVFLAISLGASEDRYIRIRAMYAIMRVGSNTAKAKLKILLQEDSVTDPDDDRKGILLQALWPHNMTIEELFYELTPPQQDNYLGHYRYFLMHLHIQLQPENIGVALEWITVVKPEPINRWFEQLVDKVMEAAWLHLNNNIAHAYIKALSYLQSHYYFGCQNVPGLGKGQHEDDSKRRFLIKFSVEEFGQTIPFNDLIHFLDDMLVNRDVEWLFEQMVTDIPVLKEIWCELIYQCFDRDNAAHIEKIYTAALVDPIIQRRSEHLFRVYALNSEEALKEKESYYQRVSRIRVVKEQHQLDPLPISRIRTLLRSYSGKEIESWVLINRWLAADHYVIHNNPLESDLRKLITYSELNETDLELLLELGQSYLLHYIPSPNSWKGSNKTHSKDFAGYRALLYVTMMDVAWLVKQEEHFWRKWAAVIVAFPVSLGAVGDAPHVALTTLAYRGCPDESIRTLMDLITIENEQFDHIFITRKFELAWDEPLCVAICEKALQLSMKPINMAVLLFQVMDSRKQIGSTVAVLFEMLNHPETYNLERRKYAASVLFQFVIGEEWDKLFFIMSEQHEIGRFVIHEVAHEQTIQRRVDFAQLSEKQLLALYEWLVLEYPLEEDPHFDDVHEVTPRENVAAFRNSIITHLTQRGTIEAYESLEAISNTTPDQLWLRWSTEEGKESFLRKLWTPISPAEFMVVMEKGDKEIVRTGEDLLNVLKESLARLQLRLQGDNPIHFALWNRLIGDPVLYRPKDENELSDLVKDHLTIDLAHRGIVVNREVEVRRLGRGIGDRVDLRVDALIADSKGRNSGTITVVIETKCIWNEKIREAMKTQLIDQYMREEQVKYGLYLIGWFESEKWDPNDRRKKHGFSDYNEVQQIFTKQADEHSKHPFVLRAFTLDAGFK